MEFKIIIIIYVITTFERNWKISYKIWCGTKVLRWCKVSCKLICKICVKFNDVYFVN